VNLADDAYNDNWVGANALRLIETFPDNAPWFLQVNFPGPHAPMDVTPTMTDWYAGVDFPPPHANDELDAPTHQTIRRRYSALVENIDRWLGRFTDAIDARGDRANTLIVFSSDHGEMLGDHNRWAKRVPYQPSAGVPLVIAGPGVREDRTESGPATTLDLTATFLDFAGLPVPGDMDSRTLRPILAGTDGLRRSVVTSGLQEWRMVLDGRYKLIRGFDPAGKDPRGGSYEAPAAKESVYRQDPVLLFDLESDPTEQKNLAEANPALVDRLSEFLPAPQR
jgi:arylsulfatase A-like enzyme